MKAQCTDHLVGRGHRIDAASGHDLIWGRNHSPGVIPRTAVDRAPGGFAGSPRDTDAGRWDSPRYFFLGVPPAARRIAQACESQGRLWVRNPNRG